MGHHCCNKQKVKRGLWSPEEDEKLVSHITIHGHGSWSSIPKLAGLQRCGKSCRLRWINYLRPDLKRGSFTEEEERTIIEVHRILGNRWAQIAKHLPGRTDNEVKNFWNSCIKKKLLAQGFDPNTHNLLPSNQNKSKIINTKSSLKPPNHHRMSSNSSSLVFSDDYDSQTCYPPNETEQQNTINFESNVINYTQLDHKAPISEFPTQLLASNCMNISNSNSNDVNLCEYIIDENSIWGTTPNLENLEQSKQSNQVMPVPDEIIIDGHHQDFDASLFNMLSLNYGFGDYNNGTILPSSEVVYGDDIGSTLDQVAWCEGNNFQSGYYSV